MSGCPMGYGDNSNDPNSSSGCPISADNMMPSSISQQPADGQSHLLPTDRQISSIPRSDGSQRWVYPSEQQFYNALVRKGHETDEKDVQTIVHIHNEMNERCWREIVRFEKFRGSEGQPRLVRFQGRPSEPTPKARIMSFLGLAPRPFDRHDWYVKRSSSGNSSSSGSKEDDGKIVRYVIDYYEGRDLPGIPVFHLDCRPAIDDFSSLVDRIKHALFN